MERQNCILIDWLSITSKSMSPEDMMELIGITSGWQLLDRGVHGYGARYYQGSMQIHFGGTQDNVWLEFSGQGCRTFESESSHKSYDVIFAALMKPENGMKLTRLDIAYDDYTGILDIERISDDTRPRNSKFKAKTNYAEVRESTNGISCDIGSSKSLILVRIYDKLAERIAKMRGREDREKIKETIPHWVRCELQLRDERALEFVKYLMGKDPVTQIEAPLTLGQAYRGVMENYLDYGYEVAARGNPKKMVWHRFKYWQEFLEDSEKLSLYRKPGKEYNLERMCNFVQNNAGNAIDAAITILGPSRFFELVSNRQIVQSSKYIDLIMQHGSYEDKLDADLIRDYREGHETDMALEFLDGQPQNEERPPWFKVFNRPEPQIWNGVRRLLCVKCQEVMPVHLFDRIPETGNLGICYKCKGKEG